MGSIWWVWAGTIQRQGSQLKPTTIIQGRNNQSKLGVIGRIWQLHRKWNKAGLGDWHVGVGSDKGGQGWRLRGQLQWRAGGGANLWGRAEGSGQVWGGNVHYLSIGHVEFTILGYILIVYNKSGLRGKVLSGCGIWNHGKGKDNSEENYEVRNNDREKNPTEGDINGHVRWRERGWELRRGAMVRI